MRPTCTGQWPVVLLVVCFLILCSSPSYSSLPVPRSSVSSRCPSLRLSYRFSRLPDSSPPFWPSPFSDPPLQAARERGKDLAAALRLVTRHDVRTLHPPEALEVQVRRMLEDRSIPLALTPPRKEGEGREGGEGEGEGEEDREGAPPSYADMARGAARVAVEGGVVSGLDGGALASDEGTGGKGEETLGGKDLDEVADVEEDSDEEVVPVPEVD